MSYERSDLRISLDSNAFAWFWYLIDGQGDVLTYGKCQDYTEACARGLKAFDAALAGKLDVEP